MATQTDKYKLKKPDPSDFYDIADFNDNADKIDAALKNHDTKLAETVTVSKGGTGATSAADARTNLGVAPISHASTATTYGRATSSNYGHAMASSANPVVAGTANVGTDNGKYAREGHVHAAQTTVSGNAGTATALQTSRTIAISGGATGTATSFNGSSNITIPVTGLNMGNANAGTLPIARGGTGGTTIASARNALGLGNATGAIPIANGGTGQTSIEAARRAFGLGETAGAVPVANGGTGATSAASALSNLGGVNATRTVNGKALSANITLSATDVGAASASHNHSADNITSGTLPITRGGTGATSALAARNNLELGKRVWSGSWKSGKITISGFTSNRWYSIRLTDLGTVIPAFNTGSWLRGSAGYRADTGSFIEYYFNSSVSGNDVTLISCSEKTTSSSGAVTIRALLYNTVSAIEIGN